MTTCSSILVGPCILPRTCHGVAFGILREAANFDNSGFTTRSRVRVNEMYTRGRLAREAFSYRMIRAELEVLREQEVCEELRLKPAKTEERTHENYRKSYRVRALSWV